MRGKGTITLADVGLVPPKPPPAPVTVERKICGKCRLDKQSGEFHHNRLNADGLADRCKECAREGYQLSKLKTVAGAKQRKRIRIKQVVGKSLRVLNRQLDKTRAIVQCLMEDPGASLVQVAEQLGLAPATVYGYVNSNAYLRSVRETASGKMTQMVPLAVKSFQQSLLSPNADVKFKSSVKLLENENVIGPQKIDLTVNDLRHKSHQELQQIIDMEVPEVMYPEAEFNQ